MEKKSGKIFYGHRTLWIGLVLVAWGFAAIALRARQIRLGYELAELRQRHVTLSREVEILRFACAREAAPPAILAHGKEMGLDLRPETPAPVRKSARRARLAFPAPASRRP